MAHDALKRAIDIAGGQSSLAAKIGVRQGDVWYWLNRSKKGASPSYCAIIERETGVCAHELRPDVFSENVSSISETAQLAAEGAA